MHGSEKPRPVELRQFGLLLGALLAVVFGLAIPWFAARPIPYWPWIAAAVLWVPALLLPIALEPLFRAWMALATVLNWMVTRLVLGFVFYAMVLPIGIVMRLAGKDTMARRWETHRGSYRKPADCAQRGDMERPF